MTLTSGSKAPSEREVGGIAPSAFGVLATLDDAPNPPGPILSIAAIRDFVYQFKGVP